MPTPIAAKSWDPGADGEVALRGGVVVDVMASSRYDERIGWVKPWSRERPPVILWPGNPCDKRSEPHDVPNPHAKGRRDQSLGRGQSLRKTIGLLTTTLGFHLKGSEDATNLRKNNIQEIRTLTRWLTRLLKKPRKNGHLAMVLTPGSKFRSPSLPHPGRESRTS